MIRLYLAVTDLSMPGFFGELKAKYAARLFKYPCLYFWLSPFIAGFNWLPAATSGIKLNSPGEQPEWQHNKGRVMPV
jgi:hypothetical protein